MHSDKKRRAVESLFVLIIITIFTAASLITVMIGTQVYTRVVDDSNAHNETRVAFSYLANKVRGGQKGGIRLETLNGTDALVLEEQYDGVSYLTYIYCSDGSLKELFAPADVAFQPSLGETVAAAGGIAFHMQDTLLVIEQTSGEHPLSMRLNLSN